MCSISAGMLQDGSATAQPRRLEEERPSLLGTQATALAQQQRHPEEHDRNRKEENM